jgi:hypothetical protein
LRQWICLFEGQACVLCAIVMIELHLFIMVVLLGTNTPEDALPPFMTGTLSGKLVLVGASVVYLEVPVLPLAL